MFMIIVKETKKMAETIGSAPQMCKFSRIHDDSQAGLICVRNAKLANMNPVEKTNFISSLVLK